MIDNPNFKKKLLRQIPVPIGGIHDPWVCVNQGPDSWEFVHRNLGGLKDEPASVLVRPGEYFRFANMNYNVYHRPGPGRENLPREQHSPFDMLRGKWADEFMRKPKKAFREARALDSPSQELKN